MFFLHKELHKLSAKLNRLQEFVENVKYLIQAGGEDLSHSFQDKPNL